MLSIACIWGSCSALITTSTDSQGPNSFKFLFTDWNCGFSGPTSSCFCNLLIHHFRHKGRKVLFCMRFSITWYNMCIHFCKIDEGCWGPSPAPLRIPSDILVLPESMPPAQLCSQLWIFKRCQLQPCLRWKDKATWQQKLKTGWIGWMGWMGWDPSSHPDLWILWIENLATACSYCLLHLVACSCSYSGVQCIINRGR